MKLQTILALTLLACSASAEAISLNEISKTWNEAKSLVSQKKASQPNSAELTPAVILKRNSDSIILDYTAFQVNYSCTHRGYNYLRYVTVPDSGYFSREEKFELEPALDGTDCPNQKTANTYRQTPGQPLYHRGHGTHQNIWDHSREIMQFSNRMTNVVPQNGVQNTDGLWRELEKRVECARDLTTVTVYLGNEWGNDSSNDYFVKSHGVTTPDYLWRIHTYKSHPNIAFAWLIPNDPKAGAKDDLAYRISLDELRRLTADDYSWPIPSQWQDAGGMVDPYTKRRCSLK